MKRTFAIILFTLWSSISYCQTTKDSLTELQSLLDSIPDISLAELGTDTSAAIIPDSLHLVIPSSIASDTTYARTCLNQAIELIKTGKYDNAYAKADTAKHIYQMNIGYVSKEMADCLHQMGRIYYYQGQYGISIRVYNKSLLIRLKRIGGNHPDITRLLFNLGVNYLSTGELNYSKKYFHKTLEVQFKILDKSHTDIAYSYLGLANYHALTSDYEKSIDYNNKALLILIKNLGGKNLLVASCYNNLGASYSHLKNHPKAIEYFKNALSIRSKIYGESHPDVALSYSNLAVGYKDLGEFDKALEFDQKALTIRLDILGNNHPDLAHSYHNLAVLNNVKQEYTKALQYNEKALAIRLTFLGKNHKDLTMTYKNMGILHFELGDNFSAIDYFQKAIISSGYKTDDFSSINSFEELIDLLKAFSLVYFKLFRLSLDNTFLTKSKKSINQAITAMDFEARLFDSEKSYSVWQQRNHEVYENAINIWNFIVSLKKEKIQHHQVFTFIEKSKARLLKSQISSSTALAFAGIPDSLLQKEYDLRIDINWREKQRQGLLEKGKTETDTTVLRISSIIFDLKREQESLFETLEKDYPEYYRLKYDTKTISLEDTKLKLLLKDQTMLEYFVGDSSIFIFVVRPDTFDVVQIKKDFPLDSLVRQMQTGLYGYHGQTPDKRTDVLYKKSIIDYTNAANELYNRIVAPVNHLLTSDLVIIPDGVLGYVPFEALLKNKPDKLNQFASYPYMINNHTISYNYSATLWQEMKNKKHKKEPTKSLVAFAPFYEGSFTVLDSTINLIFDTLPDGRDTTIFQHIVSRKNYAPLPSSGIEAGTISKMYKGEYFVNNDATEQKFYDVAGDYRFVHLSTHGVADARQGDYSYLAFAEQKDSIENEFLYVRDIYNTQLNADLVFLSACETAQGELQRGEGIISLARAFAYAGAKSIITTLWQVDDTATKDISIDFYKNLKKGFPKDVALRQAKLRHIKSAKSAQKHPFFWAAMIGIGDMDAVK